MLPVVKDTDGIRESAQRGGALVMLRTLVACLVVGAMSIVFAVSFAAIVYIGPMAPFLDRGIGLTLMGAAVMAAIGAMLFSYRGSIAGPQDLTAILLAGGVVPVAAAASGGGAEAVFATGVAFIVLTTLLVGLFATLLGVLRLSELTRYMPYPVLGGFLAATGLFLFLGAIGMVLRTSVGITDVPGLFQPGVLTLWLPWIAAGAGMVAVTRIFRGDYTLAVAVALLTVGFYATLLVTGTSLDEAREMGLLLGPFSAETFVGPDTLPDLRQVNWSSFAAESAVIAAVVGLALVGGLLNVSGLELVLGKSFDLDRDLKAIGLSNIGAGALGGLPGYPLIAEVTIANRMGLRGAEAGLVVAIVCGATAFLGADLIGMLPIGLFAAIVGYLGLDLMITWLWHEPKRLSVFDVSVILATLFCSAIVGLLPALAFGLMISVALFMLSYARNPVVRSVTSVATRPSRVERDDRALDYLAERGGSVGIFELTGFLFFGTAARLSDRVFPTRFSTIILDFSRVSGVDASAVQSLNRFAQECHLRGIGLSYAGLAEAPAAVIDLFNMGAADAVPRFATLDDAVEHAEVALLSERGEPGPPKTDAFFLSELKRMTPGIDPLDEFDRIAVTEERAVIAQGEASEDMFVLLEGAARAEIELAGDRRLTVARYLPGALIGEIAFYSGAPRTAHVIADAGSVLLRIDPHRIAEVDARVPGFEVTFHRTAARVLSSRLSRANRAMRAES